MLRCEANDADMLALLPLVDAFIQQATGRAWQGDNPVRSEAKAAARMLLVMWHENPAMTGSTNVLNFGLTAALVQLEALALQLETAGIPEKTLNLTASMPADGQEFVSVNIAPVLIFNNPMDDDAGTHIILKDDADNILTTNNILDATKRILTITPGESLNADTDYFIVLSAIADCFGQTLTKKISFRTASS